MARGQGAGARKVATAPGSQAPGSGSQSLSRQDLGQGDGRSGSLGEEGEGESAGEKAGAGGHAASSADVGGRRGSSVGAAGAARGDVKGGRPKHAQRGGPGGEALDGAEGEVATGEMVQAVDVDATSTDETEQ